MLKRNFGTDASGRNFNDRIKDQVWRSATLIPPSTIFNTPLSESNNGGLLSLLFPIDQNERRTDNYGNEIRYGDYGNTNSPLGWEIDHIKPVAKGGSDELSNLQALEWKKNREKGDQYPYP